MKNSKGFPKTVGSSKAFPTSSNNNSSKGFPKSVGNSKAFPTGEPKPSKGL